VERRYALFIAISLAAVLGSQVLRTTLFPKPEEPSAPAEVATDTTTGDATTADADAEKETAANGEESAAKTVDATASVGVASSETLKSAAAAPRRRVSLGSLDPDGPTGMLVTLSSRGGTVERIELAGEQFHDQDDRGAYIGHLAADVVPEGCRLGVVGPGTPAARAGLDAGDVIVRVGDSSTPDPQSLAMVLARAKANRPLAVTFRRPAGETLRPEQQAELQTTRRPLEVIRPEFDAAPVADVAAGFHDPLSFRLGLASRDGSDKPADGELPGQELQAIDWETEVADDGLAVRFRRTLAGGLQVTKEYRLVTAADDPVGQVDEDRAGRYRLQLRVTFQAVEKTRLEYALDGPNGLPTEGWWYAARVSRSWGGLGVRDVAMRFVGEPTALISSMTLADKDSIPPASAVLAGKPLSFAGVDALYFASGLIPAIEGVEVPELAEVEPLVVGEVPEAARRKLVNVSCRLLSKELELEPGTPVTHRFDIFAGPKRPSLLATFGQPRAAMDDLVYYGWFGWIARPMITILHVLHAIVRNYGIAIILLTVIVRGAMFPISRKQALSSQKMQVLQPEMKAIAEKYKNDPQKRTMATQELWRKHKYNPAGGCVLVFFQIPIFMGLYRSLATDVELREAPLFTSAIRWCSNLAAPDMMVDWSGFMPSFLVRPEGWLGPYLNLFPLLTIGLFLWQQKLFMPPAVDEQAKMQQQVMKYMMFFMALMFFKVPCGLCLYFIASSLWGIAERLLLPTTKPGAALAGAGGPTVVDAVANRPVDKAAATRKRRKRK
jgi:YidC/Oxa1 family membrane protein insertase